MFNISYNFRAVVSKAVGNVKKINKQMSINNKMMERAKKLAAANAGANAKNAKSLQKVARHSRAVSQAGRGNVRNYANQSRHLTRINRRLNVMADRSSRAARRNEILYRGLRRIAGAAKSIGKGMTAGVTLPMGLMGGMAVRSAAKFEKYRIVIQALTGDMSKGTALFKELMDYAARTPLTPEDMMAGTRNMLAYGIEASRVMDLTKRLGNIALGTGMDIEGLARAFGQAKSMGRLAGQEAIQFAQRGVGLYDIISKFPEMMGKTGMEIKKMGEQGLISFDMVRRAIEKLTDQGGKFHNMATKLSDSIGGLWMQVAGRFDMMMSEIGFVIVEQTGMREFIQNTILPLIEKVGAFVKKFAKDHPQMTKWIVIIAAVVTALGPLILGLVAVVAAFTFLGPALLVAGKILGVLAAMGAVSAVIYSYWDKITNSILYVARTLSALLMPFVTLFDIFAGTNLSGGLFDFMTSGKSLWSTVGLVNDTEWQKKLNPQQSAPNLTYRNDIVGQFREKIGMDPTMATVEVNVNSAPGVVASVESRSKGPVRVGANLRDSYNSRWAT